MWGIIIRAGPVKGKAGFRKSRLNPFGRFEIPKAALLEFRMIQWLKNRWEVLGSLGHPLPFLVFGFFQVAGVLLSLFPPAGWAAHLVGWLRAVPWYGWAIGWLFILWGSTLTYSVERKKRFDLTSSNFFRAYLDFLIKEGHQLFHHAGEADYFSKINDWQRKAIQGIAIGLGPKASEDFFQKVESRSPFSDAYRESTASKSGEPLSRALQARLTELGFIRMSLPESENEEQSKGGLVAKEEVRKQRASAPTAGLLTGEVEAPPAKRLPKK